MFRLVVGIILIIFIVAAVATVVSFAVAITLCLAAGILIWKLIIWLLAVTAGEHYRHKLLLTDKPAPPSKDPPAIQKHLPLIIAITSFSLGCWLLSLPTHRPSPPKYVEKPPLPQKTTVPAVPAKKEVKPPKPVKTDRAINVALRKPVIVTTNGVGDSLSYAGESSADITDGSLDYQPASDRVEDGCVGWVNSDYNEPMLITITIDLQGTYNISKVRYNPGNCQRAETWNADIMESPFGRTTTNPGSSYQGAWTEQAGNITASEVTIKLEKTRRSYATDWLFVGEIEVLGTPIEKLKPEKITIPVLSYSDGEWDVSGIGWNYARETSDEIWGRKVGYVSYTFKLNQAISDYRVSARLSSELPNTTSFYKKDSSDVTLVVNGEDIGTKNVIADDARGRIYSWTVPAVRIKQGENTLAFQVKENAQYKNGLVIYTGRPIQIEPIRTVVSVSEKKRLQKVKTKYVSFSPDTKYATGVIAKKGDKLTFIVEKYQVDYGGVISPTAAGNLQHRAWEAPDWRVVWKKPGVYFGTLIAKIGNEFVKIGEGGTIISPDTGEVIVMICDSDYQDNRGVIDLRITRTLEEVKAPSQEPRVSAPKPVQEYAKPPTPKDAVKQRIRTSAVFENDLLKVELVLVEKLRDGKIRLNLVHTNKMDHSVYIFLPTAKESTYLADNFGNQYAYTHINNIPTSGYDFPGSRANTKELAPDIPVKGSITFPEPQEPATIFNLVSKYGVYTSSFNPFGRPGEYDIGYAQKGRTFNVILKNVKLEEGTNE